VKWPKRIVVWKGDWPERSALFTASSEVPGPKNSLSDERIYVLAPKRKAKKGTGTGGGSK
jgi:hypothetical protein